MQILINDDSVDRLLELINDTDSFDTGTLIDVEGVDLESGTVSLTVRYRVPEDKLRDWAMAFQSSEDEPDMQ